VLSAGPNVEWGSIGSSTCSTPTPYTPTLYFGKGLGDLPYTLSWITPIAITGQIGYAIPARNFTATFGRGSFVVLRNPA